MAMRTSASLRWKNRVVGSNGSGDESRCAARLERCRGRELRTKTSMIIIGPDSDLTLLMTNIPYPQASVKRKIVENGRLLNITTLLFHQDDFPDFGE
jgi:hypothetical protein